MQVSDNKKDHIRRTYRTLAPLNCLLNLVGLGCNLSDKKKPRACWLITKNIIRASVLAIIDCYTLYYKITCWPDSVSPSIKYTDFVQVVYDFVQYVVDLIYVRKYVSVCSEYFKQYEVIDRILVTVNYCTIHKTLLKVMAFFGILWLSSSVCDYVAWVLGYGWSLASIYTLTYIFLLIKILTTLDLTAQVMHIDCRMRALGDLLETYCNATESCSPLAERNMKNWINTKDEIDIQSRPSNTPNSKLHVVGGYQDLKWLSRCYLLLTEQVAFVNKMYGTRILLNSLSLLIDMVRFTNIAARLLIGTQKTLYSSGYVPVVSSLMRLLTCAAVLFSLVRHCEQVYRQRERILDILYNLLMFKNPNEDIKAAATELRELIQARPIDFTMANFFRLDNSLLSSIASVVVTYTIILLQSTR